MAARASTRQPEDVDTWETHSQGHGPTMNGHGPVAPRALGPIGSLNRHSAGLGLPAQHQHPENNWNGNGSQHDMYRDIDHYAPSNYGGSHAGYDQYGNGDYGQHGHDNGQHDYDGGYDQHQQGHPSYQQQQEQFQQQSAPKKPPARGIFCCFKPKAEEPESSLDKYHHEDDRQQPPKRAVTVDEPAAVLANDPSLALAVTASGQPKPPKAPGSHASHASSKALPALPPGRAAPRQPQGPARPASRAGTEMSVKSQATAVSKHSLVGSRTGVDPAAPAAPPPPQRSAHAAAAIESFLKAVTPQQAQRDPDLGAAAADAARLQQIMRAVTPQLDDFSEASDLSARLDLACAELASGEPVTKANELAAEAAHALAAAHDWMGSNGPFRVIRSADARLMWASLFGMDVEAPFDTFRERLGNYIVQTFPGNDPKQVGDRLSKVEAAQSRLRWHVDKDNKGAVTVMDVDRAFPPHISLVERVGTLIDTLPDTAAAWAVASVNLPSRPAPGRLLGRETDVAMVLDRVTKAGEDIVVLAAPGLGASTVVAEVSNRALQKGEFPGGVYYTDLSGVESREAAAVALALTLNAPRSVAEKDVDAAIVAALRHIGPRKLTLIVFDGAESLVESSCGGGEDLRAFISKLQSVGPQFRFLVATSHPFPFDGFGVVRVGPLPSRDLIKAYQDASPAGWEWRVSHSAAKEMASLTARVPLAFRLVSGAVKNKTKTSADILLALRESRGVRIEGDLENMCTCDMQTPWDAFQEIWSDRREEKEADALRHRDGEAESDFGGDHGDARVAGLKPTAYERMVAGCVKLALAGASEPARALLVAAALLHAPFSPSQAALLADAAAPQARACLEELFSLGLVERDDRRGVFSVHPLVRSALRALSGDRDAAVMGAKQRLMGLCTRAVMAAGEDLDSGRAQLGKYALDQQRSLLDQVASHWFTAGADNETVTRVQWVAEKMEALRADRAEPDDAPVDTADTSGELTLMRSQAEDHFKEGRFERARDQYREILALQADREGGYALSTAETRVRVGDACGELEAFGEAMEEYGKALVTQVVARGTREHPDVAALHVAVGNCKLKAGDAEGAATEYRLALDVTARVFGAEALECAAPLNALGNAYREQLQLDEALERYRLALQIRRAALGETSVVTQDTLANIAAVYAQQGRFKEAGDMLLKAGLVFSRELGGQHPETVKVQVQASMHLEEHKRQQAGVGENGREHEVRL